MIRKCITYVWLLSDSTTRWLFPTNVPAFFPYLDTSLPSLVFRSSLLALQLPHIPVKELPKSRGTERVTNPLPFQNNLMLHWLKSTITPRPL